MRDNKIKEAFKKVKEDMMLLTKEIDTIRTNTKDVKVKSSDFDKKKFDNFVKNVENELNSMNLYIREFDDKLKHLSLQVGKSIEEQKNESPKIDINAIDMRFEELSEILNEKISLETASIKLEFTEEIAKIYDKVFNEILDLKNDLSKVEKNNKKKEVKEEKQTSKKEIVKEKPKVESKPIKKKEKTIEDTDELYPERKEGKIKKIAKWLFVDEEEEEMDNIKEQIKGESNNKKKDDLY
jgi:hypothetical protein